MVGRPSNMKDLIVIGSITLDSDNIEIAKKGKTDNQGRLPSIGMKNKECYVFILKDEK